MDAISRIEEKSKGFFEAVISESADYGATKISMKALTYNFLRYYSNKERIEQKFSLSKAKQLNSMI